LVSSTGNTRHARNAQGVRAGLTVGGCRHHAEEILENHPEAVLMRFSRTYPTCLVHHSSLVFASTRLL
jgi:hypothetical protein